MNKIPGRIKSIVFFALLMGVTAITWAIQQKVFRARTKQAIAASQYTHAKKLPVYDKAVLKKFELVCAAFNMQKPVFSCLGVINLNDGTDSTNNISNLNFTLCKNGNDCFYKFGDTEILNADGVYICIENKQRRVIVARQKSFIAAPVPDISQISKVLEGDYYNLTDSVKGPTETIAFVNERHISCKEYAITFDTLSKKISRVYTRLTDFRDPANKKREKIIDVGIAQCSTSADLNKYMNRYAVIQNVGGKIKLTAKYAGYELITL